MAALSACQRHGGLGASPRRVIITGDDFGSSPAVNHAIIAAHERGVLTSASLMVTGEAFEEAVALARLHPRLAVGLHLVLVRGRAALPRPAIPALVDAGGRFPDSSLRAGLRYQFDAAARRQLRCEIGAQLEAFRRTGLHLSHVDGHLHMHVHPVVLRLLIELADAYDIRAIRLPGEELGIALGLDRRHLLTKLFWWWVFGRLRRYGAPRLRAAGIGFAERVYGLLASGRLTEAYLLGLIPRIEADVVEIYAHPALGHDGGPRHGPPSGEVELAALLSPAVRWALAAAGFALTTYSEEVGTHR
jgi:hopanoid biosynthesis associated protein HpnK